MKLRTALLSAALLAVPAAHAEYKFFTPPGSFTVEVSLDNAPWLRLPMYRNAITSLEVVGDYAIGGTSAGAGLSPFVFAVSLSKRKLEQAIDLASVVPGQRAIKSGFGRGPNGVLYAGTIPDKTGESGHILQIRVDQSGIKVSDAGIPVKGEGIFALTSNPKTGAIFGITYPSGKFFVQDRGTTSVYEETAPSRRDSGFLHQYALEREDYLCRRLAIDKLGRVYGSKPVNKLFRFDPEVKRIEILEDELPEVWGRRPLGRVDSWALGPDGMLYAGNAGDGQLFKLDPQTRRVMNLGKPAMMPRMKGLAFAADGKLYGVTGGAPGYAHLFSYDPKGAGFVDLGNPRFMMTEPGIEQSIAWRGFQIGTVATSEDGRYVVMGEDEALSQLMVFQVK